MQDQPPKPPDDAAIADQPAAVDPEQIAKDLEIRPPSAGPTSPVPGLTRVMQLIEAKLLEGQSEQAVLAWATDLGVHHLTFRRMLMLVKETWRREATTVQGADALRNELVSKLFEVYRRALAKNKLEAATEALDKIAEFMMIKAPTVLIAGNGQQAAITNASRERATELLDRMRMLREKKEAYEAGAIDVSARVVPNGSNGSNGSNGHH
jgi:hypothetical protein